MPRLTMADPANVYHRILTHFPGPMEMAFSYGSGAIAMKGTNRLQNMIDFVFVVDNPQKWHADNLKANRAHYSFLSAFGPKYITKVQHFGAGVFFNTLVRCEGQLIKYGVVSTERLLSDLLDWDSVYTAGRLHKPVVMLSASRCERVLAAMHANRTSAIHASLLLLPERFTELQFFTALAGLSYAGDFRMVFGEDRNKIANIVSANMDAFKELYADVLESDDHVHWYKNESVFEQWLSNSSRFHHLSLLPKTLQERLVAVCTAADGRARDVEEVMRSLSQNIQCSDMVAAALATIVSRSSWQQAAKGLLTAGAIKAVHYAGRKIVKMIRSLR